MMKKTYLSLLFVMMVWGFNVSALSVLVNSIEPVLMTSIRIFIAGLVVLLITKMLKVFKVPNKSEIKTILYITIFNVIAHHLFLALGLKVTSGINTGAILGFGPILTMILAVIFLKNRLSRLRVLGFIIGFTGVFVATSISNGTTISYSIGDLFIFLSILAQAYSFILISKLQPSIDPRLLTGYMLVIGSIFIFISNLIFKPNFSELKLLFEPKLFLVFIFSAVVCTALGHMIYNNAIKKVGAAETAIFINLNTFFAVLGATLFLGETIKLTHIFGLLLILVGVFFGTGALEEFLRKKRERVVVEEEG